MTDSCHSVAVSLVACVLLCPSASGHEFQSWSRSQPYAGFGDVSGLKWDGETRVTDYVPPEPSKPSDLSGTTINIGGEWLEFDVWVPPPPIEIVESRRQAYAKSYAQVAEESYERQRANYVAGDPHRRDTDDGWYNLERAIFAEVVTEQDELLTRGHAIVENKSWLANDGFNLSGRLATGVLMEDSLTDLSNAVADATSRLSVTYRVNESLGYSLSAGLGGTGDVGLYLQVYRDGEVISALHYDDGLSRELQICGTLLPGEYVFEFSAKSMSRFVGQQLSNNGGEAVFDIEFETSWSDPNPPHSFVISENVDGKPSVVFVPEASAVSPALLFLLIGGCQRRRSQS